MKLHKEQLKLVLDEAIKLKGFAEHTSDVLISGVVELADSFWEELSEKEQENFNAWIISRSTQTRDASGDPGQGPKDPDPDE